MSKRLFIIISVVLFVDLSPTADAMRSPVGSGTVPPSSYRSNLFRTPNPIDTSKNMVITGNVRNGRHFRGTVPYRATTDFRAGIPSSYFDSFLRRSAGSQDFGRFSGKPTPYYSPTSTVSLIKPGNANVFKPPATTVDTRAPSPKTTETLLPRKYHYAGTSRPDTTLTNISSRPASMITDQLQKLLSTQINKYPHITEPTPTDNIDKQHAEQVEQLRRDLKAVSEKAMQLKQSINQFPDDSNLQPSDEDKLSTDPSQLPQSERFWKTETAKESTSENKPFDIYEQMKQRLDDFQKTSEPSRTKTRRQTEQTAAVDDEGKKEVDSGKTSLWTPRSTPPHSTATGQTFQIKSSPTDKSPAVDISAKAKNIPYSHKTFASSLKDKFNEHIRAAENYLKQGKYYRAADAYTLASIYKADDPLAYAGKSHALFAAGEYMSSALFLYKTLNMFPEYARFKIDIVAMVGDKDKLETRIADVERQLKKTDAPELHFLLGYIYYQIDRLREAKGAADIAYEKMPNVLGAAALKKAIDQAVKK